MKWQGALLNVCHLTGRGAISLCHREPVHLIACQTLYSGSEEPARGHARPIVG
jgi:hypothetical protein